jgi:hypothetical protein
MITKKRNNNLTNRNNNLIKKTKKTKKVKKSKDELFNIIMSNDNNTILLLNKLHNYYKNNIDNEKFNKYYNNFIPFGKKKQGKSGSVVGYLKNDNNKIIKFYYYKLNENKLIMNTNNCLTVDNKINEILMNVIINNINLLPKIKSKEANLVKKHTLLIDNYGFGDKGSFITMDKIGIDYNNNFLTNLFEILIYNHIPILKNAIKNNDVKILEIYNKFIISLISNYSKVLLILQKHINYLNTDVKLNNIFIKSVKNKNPLYNELREYGFLVDFIIILADLDKSFCYINGIQIISKNDSNFIIDFILKMFNLNLLTDTRHICNYDFNENCGKISIKKLDMLTFVINLYALYIYNLTDISFLDKLNIYLKNDLDITKDHFDLLLKTISKNMIYYTQKIDTAIIIKKVLNIFCKKTFKPVKI